eukprot:CAMPEP_0170170408 /NCGR_PEP_ID=MMETSP0040_2-20121228/3408_1 /TAXON_ID=641309 /ORGANISM="Lotharella oceanica, Strain CCMP622" /LENGTH=194 /DNA_ID=CAMNT_0010409803 /DNA_START=47 /DNA_END=631 /DNA_ORIENTATION=-
MTPLLLLIIACPPSAASAPRKARLFTQIGRTRFPRSNLGLSRRDPRMLARCSEPDTFQRRDEGGDEVGEEVRRTRRKFVGEDQDGLEAKRKNVKDKEGKTVIYQVVSQARGTTESSRSGMMVTDGSRQLLGRFRLPRNVQNGDSVNLGGEEYIVVRTTINFMLNKGKFRKEHYLVVEKSFSSILDNFNYNILRP